jgi:hypothetical protein
MLSAEYPKRRQALVDELEGLRSELAATSSEQQESILENIKRVEHQLEDLEIDQRNRSSMDADSEA